MQAGFEVVDPRFRRFVLDNAPPEKLAEGFRWIEGLVWMGDWNALLFQDIPRDRTMMWSEAAGLSVWRQPSGKARVCPAEAESKGDSRAG